jgi:hypothetical protein
VHCLRALEQPLDVDAREHGGNEAEGRERRVATADCRLREHGVDAPLVRELLERRAGVGDDEEAVSLPADPLPEVVEVTPRLDGGS